MKSKVIGISGLIILTLWLSIYFLNFNNHKLLVGKTRFVTGYIVAKNLVPYFKTVRYKIDYKYIINADTLYDHYYLNNSDLRVKKIDSLKLEVSKEHPSENKVVSFYIKN